MCWIDIRKPTWKVVTLPPAAVVLGVVMIAGCGSASMAGNRPAGAVPGSPVPSAAIPRLKAMAYRAAKVNGDSDPSWISAVVTTYKQALASATPGDIIPGAGSAAVYLLTMQGRFRSPMAPSRAPVGTTAACTSGQVPVPGDPGQDLPGHRFGPWSQAAPG